MSMRNNNVTKQQWGSNAPEDLYSHDFVSLEDYKTLCNTNTVVG